ncbi:MAG: type II secretion system F family protein [Acidimicrobiia bacterium]
MTVVAVAVAASAVFLLATRVRTRPVVDRVGRYLVSQDSGEDVVNRHRLERVLPSLPWIGAGAFVGILLAQGDLFVVGAGRSIPALAILGGSAGWFVFSARRSSMAEQRARRLRFELPVVADALALQIISGESVGSSISNVASSTSGVASEEFNAVLGMAEAESGLPEALSAAAQTTAHSDGRRLYDTLAHAHTAGGSLSNALTDLAVDYRAGLERGLTAEGGKRAITTYGPVLALMVPTTLLFLLYPTVLGLRALSGAP